jgi:hypothetical protein
MSLLPVDVLAKARTILVRSLAVGAVVLAYIFSGVGAQVAGIAGLTSLATLATTQPAAAGYRHRRRRPPPRRRRGGY